MTINVSVQYNGGFLPDIILLTLCYYHRGTRSNTMNSFFFVLAAYFCSHLNVLTIFPPYLGDAQKVSMRSAQIFLYISSACLGARIFLEPYLTIYYDGTFNMPTSYH